MSLIPMVIEQTARGERSLRHLLQAVDTGWIDLLAPADRRQLANLVVAQLPLHLESDDPEKDVHVYINSPAAAH